MRISDWSSDVCSSDLLGAKIAALRADIIDRLPALSRPAPAPVDELANRRAVARLHDRPHVGDADIFARWHVRRALGHIDLDLEVVEILGDRGDVDFTPGGIDHSPLPPGRSEERRWGKEFVRKC